MNESDIHEQSLVSRFALRKCLAEAEQGFDEIIAQHSTVIAVMRLGKQKTIGSFARCEETETITRAERERLLRLQLGRDLADV
jgi:ATP-dependent helicase YprA (DUF1998 family)